MFEPAAPGARAIKLRDYLAMKARHGPPHVGTVIWTNRAALGAKA
jgi:hypothetical protein